MPRDPYEVIGVERDASEQQIKKAFRLLARELHPDVNAHDPQAEEKFKEAAEAYAVLSDAEKRQRYDQFGHAGVGGGGGGGFQFDPSQFADFQDTLTGVDGREIEIPRLESCHECRGSGCAPGTGPQVCPQCRGNGQVAVRQAFLQMYIPCPRCEGRGQIIPSPCPACRGGGRVHKRSKVKFRIPAGVDRGQRLRIQGEGEAGTAGGGPGDLFIVFDVEEDPQYERNGFDLHRRLEVPWALLVLGGQMPVKTPYGDDVLRLPAGTPADKVVRIPNAGVPRLRGSGRGDLHLHLRVAVPQKLSPEQEALVRQLLALDPSAGTAPEESEGFLAKMFGGDKGKNRKKR